MGMLYTSRFLTVLFALFLTISSAVIAGCQSSGTAANAPSAAAPQASGKFTESDIAKLKWMEGTWRGTGETQAPFFERYKFEGTTMIVESFENESLEKVAESSRFELKNGEFGHDEGDKRSAASTITDTAVQFVPVRGIKYSFRFEKQTDGTWQAVIEHPADGDKPARKIVYKMEPWPKK